MPNSNFLAEILNELENNGNIHKQRLAVLEKETKRNIVWYHANFGHPASMMLPPDADVLENVLTSFDFSKYEGLDLYVNTLGGLSEVAARMLLSCRARVKHLRVVVPSQAMSAGTLLAMGADEVVMGPASSLGPIDPQIARVVPNAAIVYRPARHYVEAYERIIQEAERAIKENRPPHAWLQQLKDQDPSFIVDCNQARRATERIATEFLTGNMYKDRAAEAQSVVKKFIQHGDEGTHGMPIGPKKAVEMGLVVKELESDSEAWRLTREIHIRLERWVMGKPIAKCFLTRNGGNDLQMMTAA
jgi:hypothetical protein